MALEGKEWVYLTLTSGCHACVIESLLKSIFAPQTKTPFLII